LFLSALTYKQGFWWIGPPYKWIQKNLNECKNVMSLYTSFTKLAKKKLFAPESEKNYSFFAELLYVGHIQIYRVMRQKQCNENHYVY